MRDGRLRLDQTPGDGLAHIVVRNELVGAFLEQLQHRIVRHRLDGGRSNRSGAGFGLRSSLRAASNSGIDIRPHNAAMRAGAGNRRQGNVVLARQPARERCGADRTCLACGVQNGRRGRCDCVLGGRGGNCERLLSLSATFIRCCRCRHRRVAFTALILLTRRINPSDRRTDCDIHAFLADDVADRAGGRRVYLHRGLVGFDLEQQVALLDGGTLGDEPARYLAGRHVHVDLGQDDFDRHQRFPRTRSRATATIPGTCGTVAFSSSGL